MNASIPDSLRDFVLSRVATGAYTSVDDYVGTLVEADRAARERMEDELERGLGSDVVPEVKHRERFEAALAHVNRKYGKVLKKLAE